MAKKFKKDQKIDKNPDIVPIMVSHASSNYESKASNGSSPDYTSVRRNAASTITRTDRYKNIDDGRFRWNL
jgi:hypothetical protein